MLAGCQALRLNSPPTRHKGFIVVFAHEIEFFPSDRTTKLGWPWPVADSRPGIRGHLQLMPSDSSYPPHPKMFYLDCIGVAKSLRGEHNRRYNIHRLQIHEVLEVRELQYGDQGS